MTAPATELRNTEELFCPTEGRTDPVADEWERRALCLRPGPGGQFCFVFLGLGFRV